MDAEIVHMMEAVHDFLELVTGGWYHEETHRDEALARLIDAEIILAAMKKAG